MLNVEVIQGLFAKTSTSWGLQITLLTCSLMCWNTLSWVETVQLRKKKNLLGNNTATTNNECTTVEGKVWVGSYERLSSRENLIRDWNSEKRDLAAAMGLDAWRIGSGVMWDTEGSWTQMLRDAKHRWMGFDHATEAQRLEIYIGSESHKYENNDTWAT